MQIKIKKLVILSIAICFLTFFIFNRYSIILISLLVILWIDFFITKNSLKLITAEAKINYTKLFIDEQLTLIINIKNNSKFPLRFFILPPGGFGKNIPDYIPVEINPGETQSHKFQISFNTRGEKILKNITISTDEYYPFFKIYKFIDLDFKINVMPEIEITEFHNEILKKLLPEQRSFYRILEDNTYIENIKEYNFEPLNRIHWKASAKYDRLMVKKYEYTSTGKIHFFLDLNLPDNPELDSLLWKDLRRLYEEDAVIAAGGLIKEVKERNEEIVLHIFGKELSKTSSFNWIDYYDTLAESSGINEPESSFESYLEEALYSVTYEDTVVILTMFLTDNVLPTLLRLRGMASKVIVLIMPYGFRKNTVKKLENPHEIFRIEILDLRKKAEILEENRIIVRIISGNSSLPEVFDDIPA